MLKKILYNNNLIDESCMKWVNLNNLIAENCMNYPVDEICMTINELKKLYDNNRTSVIILELNKGVGQSQSSCIAGRLCITPYYLKSQPSLVGD